MQFYNTKFRDLRKKEEITAKQVIKKLSISKVTLWNWETGKIIPSENSIRQLAKAINVPISIISDLREIENSLIVEEPIKNVQVHKNQFTLMIDQILNIEKKFEQKNTLLKALTNSNLLIFYIKDINLNYVAVNDQFLNNLNLTSDFEVKGKTDFDFFSKEEAIKNIEEDKELLATGAEIKNKEAFLIGSKKKRFCLVNKSPIYNNEKINGIAAVFIDITQRVGNELNDVFLNTFINSVEYGIFIGHKKEIYKKTDIIYANNYLKNIVDFNDTNSIKYYESVLNFFIDASVDKEGLKSFINNLNYPKNFEGLFQIRGETKLFRFYAFLFSDYRVIMVIDVSEKKEEFLFKKLLDTLLEKTKRGFAFYDTVEKKFIYISSSFNYLRNKPIKERLTSLSFRENLVTSTDLDFVEEQEDPVKFAKENREFSKILKFENRTLYIKGIREHIEANGKDYIFIYEKECAINEYEEVSATS